ncbi:16S rRNA processing protein RimM [Oribacterium sp. KHPX15]|uniref:ribosome maturation factor RimM n=1 Tax=Oribacterium sp. KHPX15 TaxID=1855342 RepID=UPI0008952503|nr:ribosome maturation factor RimM [Oribacterium sp. KHPX15]SDZ89775.1 16S rRNA processing protein RimM [Oribacterium sp. KHPX15]
MQEKLRVGTIVTTHGLKGEVKVYPTTDEPERFYDLKKVWLDRSGKMENMLQLEVENVRFSKNLALVKFKEYDSIDDVMAIRKGELYVDRADAIPLAEGEYFVGDIIGCKVLDENDTELGTVKEFIETGAHDVMLVKTEGKDLMIPYCDPFILEKAPEEGYIRVHLIPGLLDL